MESEPPHLNVEKKVPVGWAGWIMQHLGEWNSSLNSTRRENSVRLVYTSADLQRQQQRVNPWVKWWPVLHWTKAITRWKRSEQTSPRQPTATLTFTMWRWIWRNESVVSSDSSWTLLDRGFCSAKSRSSRNSPTATSPMPMTTAVAVHRIIILAAQCLNRTTNTKNRPIRRRSTDLNRIQATIRDQIFHYRTITTLTTPATLKKSQPVSKTQRQRLTDNKLTLSDDCKQ